MNSIKFIPDEFHPAFKELSTGKGAWIVPLTFGRARITTGEIGVGWVDDGW